MCVICVMGSTELWGLLSSNFSEHRLFTRAFRVRISQCIDSYLCVDTCAFAVHFVGKIVEYIEEYHKVTGDPKAI